MSFDLATFAQRIPKAELHVHLEGTIAPETYERIALRNRMELADTHTLFACHDFSSFLRAFLKVIAVLRTPEDFADLAYEYLDRSARDNVRHVEFFLSPATQRKFVPDLDLEAMVQAVAGACEKAHSDFGISALLIFDMVRNLGEDSAFNDLDLAERCRQHGVVGVGLGGDERNFPARDFQRAYARAKDSGFRRTVHAGEAAGPDSVADAILLLDAERIGHGVAARGQPELLALLRERSIAIDACPTSNTFTAALPPGEYYPLREFLDAGIAVTLNSDDPAFFHATVGDEYKNAAAHGCGVEELAAIARHSFRASFLPDAEKLRLIAEVDAYYEVEGITR